MKLRQIKPEDYELILDLDRKVYPTDNPVQLETIANWYARNKEFGMIYEDRGRIKGVCIVIPLNKKGWEMLINGRLAESELGEETLFDRTRDKETGIHVYHIEKLDKKIKGFYKRVLSDLAKLTENLRVIGFSGLCVSDSGRGLFKKLGCREREFKSKEIIYGKRAEMLVLYPDEKSIVWDYIK